MESVEIREAGIQALLTTAPQPIGTGLVFAHGAGGSSKQPFLEKLAAALAERGVDTLRIDLPFRQRHAGPPRPADAAADQAGIAEAIAWFRRRGAKVVVAGGQSYGGRQASMLAAGHPALADALLFTSYPLHPPGKPDALRTAHWPTLRTPAFFAHGTRDPFGTIEEMQQALRGIGCRHELYVAEGQGHSQTKLAFIEPFLKFLYTQ
jgi:uncharacterized protein